MSLRRSIDIDSGISAVEDDLYAVTFQGKVARIFAKVKPVGHAAEVLEALAALRDEGVALGVCTNKPERLSRLLLEALGLTEFFGAVVGRNDSPERPLWPGPEGDT